MFIQNLSVWCSGHVCMLWTEAEDPGGDDYSTKSEFHLPWSDVYTVQLVFTINAEETITETINDKRCSSI